MADLKAYEIPYVARPTVLEEPQLRNSLQAPKINADMEIADETIFAKKLVVGGRGWTTDIVFSPVDNVSVTWNEGAILFADGSSYTVAAGPVLGLEYSHPNTFYIYFDQSLPTELQATTTYSEAISDTRVLLAIVTTVATTGAKVIISAVSGLGTTIDGDKIVTGKIQSADGRTYIDLDLSQIVTSDGTNPRTVQGTV